MIPDPLKRWATTDVTDYYYPYLEYLVLLSKEIEDTHRLMLENIEKESDRRLEILRDFYRKREGPHGDLPIYAPGGKDWR